MGAKGGQWLARAVSVRVGKGRPRGRLERLPHAMLPKELHAWVRERFGDRAAYWPEDVQWQPQQ